MAFPLARSSTRVVQVALDLSTLGSSPSYRLGVAGPSTARRLPGDAFQRRRLHASLSPLAEKSTASPSLPSTKYIDPSLLLDLTTDTDPSAPVTSPTSTEIGSARTPASSTLTPARSARRLTLQEEQQLEREDEWRRNLRKVRSWRKGQEVLKSRLANIQPPSSSTQSSTHQTFPNPKTHLLSALLASGAQLGHSPTLLSPPFLPYITGTRSGIHIIDLEQTVPLMRKAAHVVREVVKQDGVVLFVGTREAMKGMVEKASGRLGVNGYAVAGKSWMAGTLTNSSSFFGMQPIRARSHVPDLVVILNPSENPGLVRECTTMKVPTIGIVDTNTDPRIVTYAIPANMESTRTCELIVTTLSIAGQAGREMRLREEAKQRASY